MNPERVGHRLQWTQWLAALAASSAMFSIDSLDIVWMSDRKEEHAAPLIGTYNILVIIGAIIGAVFADSFGRKNTLLMMLVLVIPRTADFLLHWTGLSWMDQFVLNGFQKVGSGITCTLVPLYISEISDTNKRGNLMVMQLSVVQSGMLALYTVISLTGHSDYFYEGNVPGDDSSRLSSIGSNQVLGVALLSISIFFHAIILGVCPETPQYLNWKKMYSEAAQSLGFFRRIKHVIIRKNTTSLPANGDGNKKGQEWGGKMKEIFQLENRKSLAIIFSLIIIKWASGIRINERNLIQTILMYRWPLAMPLPVLSYFTAIFIFSVFLMFTIGVFERKSFLLLVILGSLITSVIGMTTLVHYEWVYFGISTVQHVGHLTFVAVTLAYAGKFFPVNVRATAIALIISFEVLCRSAVSYIKWLIFAEPGNEFLVFQQFRFIGGVHVAAIVLVLIFFPKTRKVSSEIEIETFNGIEYL